MKLQEIESRSVSSNFLALISDQLWAKYSLSVRDWTSSGLILTKSQLLTFYLLFIKYNLDSIKHQLVIIVLTAVCGIRELDIIPRNFQEVVDQVYSSRWRESVSLKAFRS